MENNIHQIKTKVLNLRKEQYILGRDNEINAIIKHFDRVLEGEFATCIIRGEAGVGKTYLVSHVAKKMLNLNSTYIYGKFKQYNNSLFSGIKEILNEIIEQALTFSENRLNSVKELLKSELSTDCDLIIAICPDAEKIMGYSKKVREEDYHKLEHRIQRAIQIFLDILSQELYPLIIHIDDLQWADQGSLRILNYLCHKPINLNIYLILSLRTEIHNNLMKKEVSKVLGEQVKNNLSIELKRLNLDYTKEILNTIFDNQIYECEKVTEYVFKATLGMPFYIDKLLETIFKENKICIRKNKWIFDISFLKKLQLPEDIENILNNQINELSLDDRRALQLLACLGGQADRKMLIKTIITKKEMNFDRLEKLCITGLLIKEEHKQEEHIKYLFSHDIIFELIHNSMSESVKEENHYCIANKLINDSDKFYKDEHRIFIGLQLLDCKDRIQNETDISKYVVELYYAGIKAKRTTLIEEALSFFKFCTILMPLCNPSISFNFSLTLRLELAESYFICGYKNKAQNEFKNLIKNYRSENDQVRIKRKLVMLYTHSGDNKKVIELSMEIFEHLDFKLRTNHVRLRIGKELLEIMLQFTINKIERLTTDSTIEDIRVLTIQDTLIRMASVANLIDDELFYLLIMKLCNLSIKYGNSDFSAPSYAAFSYMLYHHFGDDIKSFKVMEIAKNLLKNSDNTTIKCMTYFIMGTFIEHWKSSAENSIDYLMKSIEIGVQGGEFQYASYAYTSMIEMRYAMGIPFSKLTRYVNLLNQYDIRIKQQEITKLTLSILQNHMDQLRGIHVVEIEGLQDLDKSQILTFYYLKLQRLYLEEKIKECYDLLEKIIPMSEMFKGYILQADCLFFTILVQLDSHRSLKGIEKIDNRIKIVQAIRRFEKWVALSKHNHFARYLFIKAKYGEIFSNSSDVGLLYEEGINYAKEHQQFQLEALGNLLAGKYFEKNTTIANVYRKKALIALDKWGATYYAELIRVRYNIQSEEDTHKQKELGTLQEKSIQKKNSKNFIYNMSYHMKQIENMDEDQTFLYVLKVLVEVGLAGYGAIYLENNDQVHMAYEWIKGNTKKYSDPIHMEKVQTIPRKVMRYVVRKGKKVIIKQKPTSGLFVNDKYFNDKEEFSILCIPLKYMGVMCGIIYLEWDICDAYSDDLIEAIQSYEPLLVAKTILKPKDKQEIKIVETLLTERETEVLKCITKGLTNKQIGDELSISLSTVKTHIINIYSKLNIKNRVAAVEKARELKLIY